MPKEWCWFSSAHSTLPTSFPGLLSKGQRTPHVLFQSAALWWHQTEGTAHVLMDFVMSDKILQRKAKLVRLLPFWYPGQTILPNILYTVLCMTNRPVSTLAFTASRNSLSALRISTILVTLSRGFNVKCPFDLILWPSHMHHVLYCFI